MARVLDSSGNSANLEGISNGQQQREVTVGTGSTEVSKNVPSRNFLLLVNDSDEVVYISIGEDAVSNTGIRLNASGGSYQMSQKGGNLTSSVINAICASGSKVLTVTESA
tara:strand:- start:87 stop:416 length:330 start_codon:yes stop_codon:yes gene_type:complete